MAFYTAPAQLSSAPLSNSECDSIDDCTKGGGSNAAVVVSSRATLSSGRRRNCNTLTAIPRIPSSAARAPPAAFWPHAAASSLLSALLSPALNPPPRYVSVLCPLSCYSCGVWRMDTRATGGRAAERELGVRTAAPTTQPFASLPSFLPSSLHRFGFLDAAPSAVRVFSFSVRPLLFTPPFDASSLCGLDGRCFDVGVWGLRPCLASLHHRPPTSPPPPASVWTI